jgi:hypothetical protein
MLLLLDAAPTAGSIKSSIAQSVIILAAEEAVRSGYALQIPAAFVALVASEDVEAMSRGIAAFCSK